MRRLYYEGNKSFITRRDVGIWFPSRIFENINMPVAFTQELKAQIERLKEARAKFGEDIISPFEFLDQ